MQYKGRRGRLLGRLQGGVFFGVPFGVLCDSLQGFGLGFPPT